MEYCADGHLLHLTKEKRIFEESDVLDILSNVFEAVAFIHAHGVIHRDLKPENIVIQYVLLCINVGNVQNLWFWLGCLCWTRSKDYFLWDSSICEPWSLKGRLLWYKDWYLGFRSLNIWASLWHGTIFDNKTIRHGKNSERPSTLPKLGSNIPITFIFNQMYAGKRSIKSPNIKPSSGLPTSLKLP